jgi:hypothetical protein
MYVKYSILPKIYQHFPIIAPPPTPEKITQIGIFGFENKPSGNPVVQCLIVGLQLVVMDSEIECCHVISEIPH